MKNIFVLFIIFSLILFQSTSSISQYILKRGNGTEPDSLDPHKATGTWENNIIPIQNYLMWFLVAFVMQWIISYKSQLLSNKLSFVLLLSQFLFFVNLVEWNF